MSRARAVLQEHGYTSEYLSNPFTFKSCVYSSGYNLGYIKIGFQSPDFVDTSYALETCFSVSVVVAYYVKHLKHLRNFELFRGEWGGKEEEGATMPFFVISLTDCRKSPYVQAHSARILQNSASSRLQNIHMPHYSFAFGCYESSASCKSRLIEVFPRLAGFGVLAIFRLAAAKYSPTHQNIIKLVESGHNLLKTSQTTSSGPRSRLEEERANKAHLRQSELFNVTRERDLYSPTRAAHCASVKALGANDLSGTMIEWTASRRGNGIQVGAHMEDDMPGKKAWEGE
ncbi:hypothetical protein C8R45DRAFT_1069698 [Mycena sanguinolenta]|nr:hypothetical protein C8R45DRAFT_1069698 [Mycena sanguinolenta]